MDKLKQWYCRVSKTLRNLVLAMRSRYTAVLLLREIVETNGCMGDMAQPLMEAQRFLEDGGRDA